MLQAIAWWFPGDFNNHIATNRQKEVYPMASLYDDIVRFMKEYFPAYSEKGQVAETQHIKMSG
jgi:hypothetical protein